MKRCVSARPSADVPAPPRAGARPALREADSGRRSGARAGFSLIEALVALAISAAIFVAVGQISAQALHNWSRGQGSIAAMEMLTRGLGRLAADLSAALPERTPGSDASTVFFRGDATGILFVAATGIGAGHRGVEIVSVATVPDDQGTAIIRRRGPLANLGTRLDDPVPLLSGRIVVRFAYVDRAGQRQASWLNRPELPALVEVEIYNAEGQPVFPVPAMLAIPANLSAQCLGSGKGDEKPGVKAPEKPKGCTSAKPAPPPDPKDESDEDDE